MPNYEDILKSNYAQQMAALEKELEGNKENIKLQDRMDECEKEGPVTVRGLDKKVSELQMYKQEIDTVIESIKAVKNDINKYMKFKSVKLEEADERTKNQIIIMHREFKRYRTIIADFEESFKAIELPKPLIEVKTKGESA